LIYLLLWAAAPRPAEAESREYQIKAAFLVNFLHFVTWPPGAFTKDEMPFCIGILGEDPFGAALDQAVRSETVGQHPIIVRRWKRLADCKGCQLLFMSRSEEKNMDAILGKLRAQPILTVSETRGFARSGGIINFYLEGNKVRFEINPAAALRSHLKISAQLLNLGKIIDTGGGGQ
jgi:hypothetical protein